MKKRFTKAVTLTVATTMLIGTIPFTATGVLAGESKYPAIATYNEIGETQTNIYDELEKVAQQDSVLQEELVAPQALELDTSASQKSGMWGTCTWNIDDDGVLNISGGVAKTVALMPWFIYKGEIKKINITDKITFEDNTSLNGPFLSLTNLEEIKGFEKLDTSNVTDMSNMFSNCSSLTTVDLSNLDTSKVTNMDGIFSNCNSLEKIDLSNFDLSNIESVSYLIPFNATEIIMPKNFGNDNNIANIIQNMQVASWKDEIDNIIYDTKPDTLKEGHKYVIVEQASLAGTWGTCAWNIDDDGVLTISGGVGESTSDVTPWYVYSEKIKKIKIEDKITFKENTELKSLFSNLANVEEIDGLGKLDTSNVTSMRSMFYNCSSLTTLDLSNLDTSNVTDMSWMFQACNNLTTLDMGNLDTSNVINMGGMFNGCSSLTTLDISNLDTSNVISMWCMFSYCSSLTKLDISNLDTSNVIYIGEMFANCSSLTTLDLSNLDTTNVTDMSGVFSFCNSLTTLELGNFNTTNVTNMSSMFYSCSNLTTLELGNFNTTNVTNMRSMFYSCSNLTTLNLSDFNTENVTDMSGMFSGCNNLKAIDVSNFNTSKVTNMSNMFGMFNMGSCFDSCSNLTTIDVSNFDTSNVTNMQGMFAGCGNLKTVDVSKFNTENVTNMGGMFSNCTNLTSIDLSSFNISKINYLFNCKDVFLNSGIKEVTMPQNMGSDDIINEIINSMPMTSWTDKTANVKYDGKPDTLIAGHRYVVTDSEYDKELTIQASKSENNNTVTFTASGNGGSGKYTYKFIVYNKTTNQWAKLQDFSEKNTFTWTKGNAGDRYFYVDIKDNSTGKVVRSEALNVKIEETTKPLAINATKKEADKTVTFTAEGSGGSGKYSYKFIVYNKTTNSWAKLQDFSSKNTFTWTKGNAGDRYFYVDVKDNSTGKVVRSEALNVKLGNTTSKPTSTLTASTDNVNVGGKVTLTAKATDGSGKYTYKFLIYNPTTKQWAKLQDFSDKSTFTWTAGSAGARQFYVDVKDSNGNVTRSKVVNVGVGNAQPTTKLSVKATASTTANKVGQNVTFTATGNGGAGGYTYKFLVYNKTTKQWAKLQDFSATSKLTWKAGSAGERQFYVDVKDKNGNTVRSSVMNVNTTK